MNGAVQEGNMADNDDDDGDGFPYSIPEHDAALDDPFVVTRLVRRACDALSNRSNDDDKNGEGVDGPPVVVFPAAPLHSDQLNRVNAALRVGTNLRGLNLSKCLKNNPDMLRPFFEQVLPTHPSLTELVLASNNLKSHNVHPLGWALRTNTRLTIMRLDHNFIGSEGFAHFIEGISENESSALSKLYVGNNRIGNSGMQALPDAFNASESITRSLDTLCLQGNEITDTGLHFLGSFLGRKNVPLTYLDVSNNCFDSYEDAGYFSAMVKDHPTLQTLLLCGCFRDNTNAAFPLISTVLPSHPSLVSVCLDNNRLIDLHATLIASSLVTSKIKDLKLGGNTMLWFSGIFQFTNAFSRNQHLESLSLYKTGLDSLSMETLISSLRHSNYKLTTVNCKGNRDVTSAQKGRIQELCSGNVALKKALNLFLQGKNTIADIPWERVIELKDEKPELVYQILRKDPANMVEIMEVMASAMLELHRHQLFPADLRELSNLPDPYDNLDI